MSGIQSPERISGKASQEATRLNSLLKNNGLITTQNEREEIGFIEDRVGKNVAESVKIPSNITSQEILAAALRQLFTEGSHASYEKEQDRIREAAIGKGRNFLQNTFRWATSTVGKQFESTYMGLAHAGEGMLNFSAKNLDKTINYTAKAIGKEEWAKSNVASMVGSDNMGSLLKLTGEIFSNTEKFGTDKQIKEALHNKIYQAIVPNEKMGLLTGEAAQMALALSEFGPFNKNTGQVLAALKNQQKPEFASKIDFVLDKLCDQINQARFNEAQINGVEESIEGELLSDIVEIQNKLKASGVTGAREVPRLDRFVAGLGLGTLTTTVNLVKTAAGSNLGENRRLGIIKEEVKQSEEFLTVKNEIVEKVKSEVLSPENANLLLEQALNKISYNTYLQVVKESIKANKEITAKLTMSGVAGFVNNALDQGFALSNIKDLNGGLVGEQDLQRLIKSTKDAENELKSQFAALEGEGNQELKAAAEAMFKSVEKVTIIPTDGTKEFAESIRQRQVEITDNAALVTAKLAIGTLKEARNGAVMMVASTPYIAGLGAAFYQATGGSFGFSVNKADVTGGLFQENNLIQSRFDKGLGLNRGDMAAGQQVWNGTMNLLARANGTGNVFNALSMVPGFIDAKTGGHVGGAIGASANFLDEKTGRLTSNSIEAIKSAGNRVGEFAARIGSNAGEAFTNSAVNIWDNKIAPIFKGDAAEAITSNLPQPAQADGLLAQTATGIAQGGTDKFSVGEKVYLPLGGEVKGNSEVIGQIKGGITVFKPDLKSLGISVQERQEGAAVVPVLIDKNGKEVNTAGLNRAYLMDPRDKNLFALDQNGNKVVVLVTPGSIDGAIQISSNTISSSPTIRVDNNVVSNSAAKPEVTAQAAIKPEVTNNVVTSNLSGNFRLTGGGVNGSANRLMEAGLAEEKNGGVFIKQATSININGRNIVIPVGQYSALTIANAARITDTSIEALNRNPVTVSFGAISPDMAKPTEVKPENRTQPQTAPNSAKPTINFGSSKNTFGADSATEGLLNRGARIDPDLQSGVNSNQFDQKPSTSGSSALEMLRQRTSTAANEVMATVQGTFVPQEKPADFSNSHPGRITVDASKLDTRSAAIPNNSLLIANIATGNNMEGFGRKLLEEIHTQVKIIDQQSYATVQSFAVLSLKDPNYKLTEAQANLSLPGGKTGAQVWEAFKQDQDLAREVSKGKVTVGIGAIDAQSSFKGSFIFLPIPGGVTASAEYSKNFNLSVLGKSTYENNNGFAVIKSPTISGEQPDASVKVENGKITATQSAFKVQPLSELLIKLPNGKEALLTKDSNPEIFVKLNSGKDVTLDEAISAVAKTDVNVAKSFGYIDTKKSVSNGALNVKTSSGFTNNVWDSIQKTGAYFATPRNADGSLLQSDKVGSEVRDTRDVTSVISILKNPNGDPGQKIAMVQSMKQYVGQSLSVAEIINLKPAERAAWSSARAIEKISPGFFDKTSYTNLDFDNLQNGLQFSSTESIAAAIRDKLSNDFAGNLSKFGNMVPAALYENYNPKNATVEESRLHYKNIEDYVRSQNRGKLPIGWQVMLKEGNDVIKENIGVVQTAMGVESGEDIKSSHNKTSGFDFFKGFTTSENSTFSYFNTALVAKETSLGVIQANIDSPQVKEVKSSAFTNIMGININGINNPLINKLAVSAILQVLPFAFAMGEEKTSSTKSSRFGEIPQLTDTQKNEAARITAIATMLTAPKVAEKFDNNLSKQQTPVSSMRDALGVVQSSSGEYIVRGPNGVEIKFKSVEELNKTLNNARNAVIVVSGEELKDASTSSAAKVFKDMPSVTTGGMVLDKSEASVLMQGMTEVEAKKFAGKLQDSEVALKLVRNNFEQVNARANTTFTIDSFRKALGAGKGIVAGIGLYTENGKAEEKIVAYQHADNTTLVRANLDDIEKFKKGLIKTIDTIMDKCTNPNSLVAQPPGSLTVEGSQEIASKKVEETNVRNIREEEKGNVAMGMKLNQPREQPKQEQSKPPEKQPELNPAARAVPKANPNSIAPGANPNPPVQGGGNNLNQNPPAANPPGTNQLPTNQPPINGSVQPAIPTPNALPPANGVGPGGLNPSEISVPSVSVTAPLPSIPVSNISTAPISISIPASEVGSVVTQTPIVLTTGVGAIIPTAPINPL